MKRAFFVYLPLTFALAIMAFSETGRLVIFTLLFGWVSYLNRVLPEAVVRWDGVTVFVIGLVLFTGLLHVIARWLRWEMSGHTARWRLRSTLSVAGIVVVAFAAGIAVVGVTHQTIWLAKDREDLLVTALPGNRNASKLNLRQIGLGVHNYHETFSQFPTTEGRHSWVTQSLPYLSMSNRNFDLDKPWNHPNNQPEIRKLVPCLLNPALRPVVLRDENGYGLNHYAGNSRLFDDPQITTLNDVHDGTANTLMFGEVHTNFQPWAKPGTHRDPALGLNRSPRGFGSPTSTRGAAFLLADGSVRRFSRDIDPGVLKELSTPNGGEPVTERGTEW